MESKRDAGLGDHLERGVLESVRIEGGGEDDGVRLGGDVEVEDAPSRPLAPHRLGGAHPGVPVDVGRIHAESPAVHALDHLHREAADGDLGVVVHVVEHEDHPARGEPSEVRIALDEGHARSVPGGGDGGRDAGRAPAHHQDVRRGDHGNPALRPDQRLRRLHSAFSILTTYKAQVETRAFRGRGLCEGTTSRERGIPARDGPKAPQDPRGQDARAPREGDVSRAPSVHGQNTSGGFHLSTRRSTRVTIANAATAIPAPRMTVA